MSKKNILRIIVSALALILIIYTLYHIISSTQDLISTTPAGLATERETVAFEGLLVRNERPVASKYSGEVNYLVGNGEKLNADSPFAEVYSEKVSRDLYAELIELKEALVVFKASNHKGNISVNDIQALNEETDAVYKELMLANDKGDTSKAKELERELLICLNKKKIFDGTIDNYDDEIKACEKRINSLYSSIGGQKETLLADEGGYFYYQCDGYEEELGFDLLNSFNTYSLKAKINEIENQGTVENDFIGKIVYDYRWYILVPSDVAIAEKLEEGFQYRAYFYDGKEFEIPLILEKKTEPQGEELVLVFSSGVMPNGFEFDRVQGFRVEISSVRGYRVPTKALVENKDGQKGVYILNSSVVYFKKVNVLAEYEGYYIVAECDKSKDGYKEYLDINDLIIISNVDSMYEGKIIR